VVVNTIDEEIGVPGEMHQSAPLDHIKVVSRTHRHVGERRGGNGIFQIMFD
jgi:hypothetical protein